MKRLALVLALTLALAPAAAAQVTIGAPGGSEVRTWGVGNTAIYGQTFTTPTANILESFSLWFGRTSPISSTPTPSINFNAYVYAWNAALNTVSGSALFTSALMNYATNDAAPFTQLSWNTGGLGLTSGDMYVLFVQTAGGEGGIFMESTVNNEYTGGDFVFNNSSDPTTTWSGPGFPTATDLRFEAEFSAVPEPSTWLLLATGLLALAYGARDRKEDDDDRT